jgi:DNA-nicking Smr family endonuclease
MPPRARHLSEADQALWAKYAEQLAPLRGRPAKKTLETPENSGKQLSTEPPPLQSRPRTAPPAKLPSPIAARNKTALLAVGAQPGGLDKATWHRFQSGKLVTARTLDLHGMTAHRAFHALVSFLRTAHAEQVRCVEVVTGRGSGEAGSGERGVIRREFPHWLNLPEIRPLILGAAHPHAMNQGSVRLILRRIR